MFAYKKASPQIEGPPPPPDTGMLDSLLRKLFGIGISEFQQATVMAQGLVDEFRTSLLRIEERLDRIERVLRIEQGGGRRITVIDPADASRPVRQ